MSSSAVLERGWIPMEGDQNEYIWHLSREGDAVTRTVEVELCISNLALLWYHRFSLDELAETLQRLNNGIYTDNQPEDMYKIFVNILSNAHMHSCWTVRKADEDTLVVRVVYTPPNATFDMTWESECTLDRSGERMKETLLVPIMSLLQRHKRLVEEDTHKPYLSQSSGSFSASTRRRTGSTDSSRFDVYSTRVFEDYVPVTNDRAKDLFGEKELRSMIEWAAHRNEKAQREHDGLQPLGSQTATVLDAEPSLFVPTLSSVEVANGESVFAGATTNGRDVSSRKRPADVSDLDEVGSTADQASTSVEGAPKAPTIVYAQKKKIRKRGL